MKKNWIEAELIADTGKTKKWNLVNKSNRVILGEVRWWGGWRRYAFFPDSPDLLFDADCLREIADFLEAQMNERKI